MKVTIITEGGKRAGFGHLARCMSLYQAFEEQGFETEIVINGDETVECFVKGKSYQTYDWLEQNRRLFESVMSSEAVVIDSYLADSSLYEKISDVMGGQIIMIDDYKRLDYPGGLVVCPGLFGDRLDYPEKPDVQYLWGNQYVMLRKEFQAAPEKEIKDHVRDVLLTFGGVDQSAFIEKIIDFLGKKHPGFKYHAIVSGAGVSEQRLNRNPAVDAYSGLSTYKMLELMKKCDLAISGGGQTLYELIRVGVPTIGICFADNQLLNIEVLAQEGLIQFAGGSKDQDIYEKIEGHTADLDYDSRLGISRTGQGKIDGLGSKRLSEEVLKWVKQQ